MEQETPSGNTAVGEKLTDKSSETDTKESVSQLTLFANAITLAEKLAVATPKEARQSIAVESLKAFESRMIEGRRHVSVPSNLEDLVQQNYLFTLAALALKASNCIIVVGKDYKITFTHTVDQTLILNGFGVPLVEGMVPKFRNDFRGPFKNGLLCAMMYITEGIKFCDKRWFQFNESRNILHTLFGEAWATKHQDEKIILDFIISVMKTVKVLNMESYLINIDELKKRLGLKSNRHKNPIISNDEQKFIEEDYKLVLSDIREFKYNKYDDWEDLIQHMVHVQKLCKAAKPYSDLCKELTSTRLDFVFKGQKKISKKQPIGKLVSDKKNSDIVGYVKVFNPCRAAGCKVAFRIGHVPQKDEERNQIRIALREWKASLKGVNALQVRLPTLESWYYEVLDL